MADSTLSRLLTAGTLGTSVYRITGDSSDAAAAAGYGAWVESITGSPPYIEKIEEGRAGVYLTPEQALSMRQWMESKLQRSLLPSQKSTLEIEFGPVVKPIAVKYITVFSALFFLAGWIARSAIR